MDLADLQRKARAALQFQVADGPLRFTLQLPTVHEMEMAVFRAAATEQAGAARTAAALRAVLEAGIVDWSGVTLEHLAPGAGPEPATPSPAAAALLLDAQPALAERLRDEFLRRLNERNERQAELEKN